jgi:hypothetical protein
VVCICLTPFLLRKNTKGDDGHCSPDLAWISRTLFFHLFSQVDGLPLESAANNFHREFARNDYFKLGCALCVLLKDQLLTRTQVLTPPPL